MVEVIKDICGTGSPRMHRRIVTTCDECGCRCDIYGTYEQRLYQYGERQLCLECLVEDLTEQEVIDRVTE